MEIKIKKIEFIYTEDQYAALTGARVDYSLIIPSTRDSTEMNRLEGSLTINNGMNCKQIQDWQLWEFNRHIHKTIMEGL